MLPFGLHFEVIAGPWPWSLLNLVSAVALVRAIVLAWRWADRVVIENRPWTRAWWILVAGFGLSIGGIWLPIGAVYVLAKFHGSVRRPARRGGSSLSS